MRFQAAALQGMGRTAPHPSSDSVTPSTSRPQIELEMIVMARVFSVVMRLEQSIRQISTPFVAAMMFSRKLVQQISVLCFNKRQERYVHNASAILTIFDRTHMTGDL